LFDLSSFLLHAGIFIGLATFFLLVLVIYNPRLMMQDYPPAIKSAVPPKTEHEKRLSIWLGLPFMLVLFIYPFYATFAFQAQADGGAGFSRRSCTPSGSPVAFNLWDWLVLDWLVFCTLTPRNFVLPGTEGHPAYKDYVFHSFLIGTVYSILMALITA
jgi:hypothetical protein